MTSNDTVAPSVSIVLPNNGDTVRRGAVHIKAVATDNEAVTKVEFYIDGTRRGTDRSGGAGDTFRYTWCDTDSQVVGRDYSLVARAFDRANSSTSSVPVTVTVGPIADTIIDWSGAVEARSFQLWHEIVQAGYSVSGSFSADGQYITFLLLDSLNFQKWGFHQPYTGLVKVDSSPGSSFDAAVPQTGLFHFILDNTNNPSTDTAVHLFVKTISR